MANPFTPGFGTTPRVIAGRDVVLGEIGRAFGGAFDPHRTTWLRAPRGSGKTVLLNEVQDLAGSAGWAVVQEDGQSPGLCARIARHLQRGLLPRRGRRVTSASVTTPVGGASLELDAGERVEVELRETLEQVLDQRDPPAGVLITVDEIHTADRADVAHFGNAVQHVVRQDRPVAAVVAGLPVDDDDDRATFLLRCTKPTLEELSSDAVRLGLQETAALEGGRFTGEALDLAVRVVAGYPYMLQLVGYWSWDHGDDGVIETSHVLAALPRCERELTGAVVGTVVDVSPVEQRYLEAMSVDDGPSRTSEVARRMGKSPQYANVYRTRLIERGVVVATGVGWVDFAVPGHRARLRIDAARGS